MHALRTSPAFSAAPLSFLTAKPYSRQPPKPFPTAAAASSSVAAAASSSVAAAQTLAMPTAVDEPAVGIACYVSSLPGFRGVLKQRYADFIVNEVDPDGAVVRLSSLDPPPELLEEICDDNPPPSESRSYTDEIELFRSLSGDADAEMLQGLLEKVKAGEVDNSAPVVLKPDSVKSHRAEVHNFFKKHFKFLVTDTVDGVSGEEKCVRVRFGGEGGGNGRRGKKRKDVGGAGRPFDSRGSDSWPENRGKFLKFHLYKENKDTQEALGVICKMLGVQQRAFGFSGTKDKRAITTQRVTIFKQHAKRLAALNSRLFGIKVGDFCYVREGLLLGQLFGNRFTVTLRGVVADSEDTIKAAAEGLGRNGFINYYGLQRFGSGSVPTHLIGAALLRGEWKTAVDLILDPREGERDAVRLVREDFKVTGDIDLALRQLPRYLVAERAVLQCLKKSPGNYLQALRSIPRTLRMMYVHSYQSYLWNHAASMRVQKHGVGQVVVGDLVFCKDDTNGNMTSVDILEADDDCDETDGLYDISDVVVPEEKVQSVKAVSVEDLRAGSYTFEDVVLPLPGSRVIYPTNDIAAVYHDTAEKDGINLIESVHCAKEFSITRLTGDYRRVFQRPVDFEWELLTYTDGNVPLAETDLDIMSKVRSANIIREEGCANGVSGTSENSEIDGKNLIFDSLTKDRDAETLSKDEPACNSDPQSPKMALKLGFTLPASCYATMAIRELLKTSTSVAYHKTINQ